MHLSFTGTQRGMTPAQRARVTRWVGLFSAEVARHGGCAGADREFNAICLDLNIPRIEVWPGDDEQFRIMTETAKAHASMKVLPALPYMERNTHLAKLGDCLFATPMQTTEALRSGTWSTIRRARRFNKRIYVFLPSGRVVNGYDLTQDITHDERPAGRG